MNDKTNVRILSNIFPVKTVPEFVSQSGSISYRGVCRDSRFRTQVRGKPALKKLAEAILGGRIRESSLRDDLLAGNWVEKWQIDVFWEGQGTGDCVDCPYGARPFGIVRRDGQYLVENRCEKLGCRCR